MRFVEGSMTDLFEMQVSPGCALQPVRFSLILDDSKGILIFDTSAGRPGYAAARKLRIIAGSRHVRDPLPEVPDGATVMDLPLVSLPVEDILAFTIDLDDQLADRRRRTLVTGAELEGTVADLLLDLNGQQALYQGRFNARGEARIPLPGCAVS